MTVDITYTYHAKLLEKKDVQINDNSYRSINAICETMHSKFSLCGFAFAVLISHALGQTGFTSIDCGLPLKDTGYNDTKTGIFYTSDQNLYIDTGVISTVDSKYSNDSDDRQLRRVRYFPQDQGQGNRSCYNLTSIGAASRRYLIRATFRYGNYDGKNQPPGFHLYLGVDFWDTVEIKDSTSVIRKEIIHVPSSNNLHVCLVNTGAGTPFISALELRQLTNDSYMTSAPGESLALSGRVNLAPPDPRKVIRFPDDKYDRLWYPFPNPDYWVALNTTSTDLEDNQYNPPDAVMQSAAAPRNPDYFLGLTWGSPDVDSRYYLYLHFAEVVRLRKDELRRLQINVNGALWFDEAVVPVYLSKYTVYATRSAAAFNFSLVKAQNSTLPPILNAFEYYLVKQMLQSQTDENDASAILNIKSAYGVKRDWQGDPCLPKAFIWSGLDCVNNAGTSNPPRISSLNLSSYGLNGTVSFHFSKLTSLESLDLSDNNLHGSIPDFLSELPQLKVLNLLGNNFSGSIPQILLDKATSGSLLLSVDGSQPDKCDPDKCKSGKNSKFLVILISVLSMASILVLVILATVFLIWRFKRNTPQVARLGSISQDNFLQTKSIKFSYSDLLKMTSNFQRVLGTGGFGTVYHGITPDGKEVAVKLLSQSSAQGYNEFQIEAELLTRVHHRNLTILVGYCYESNHMALVYEYMAHGNLREHLSGDNNVLSWSERLHISLDAAQGLDYLHNGCKPPIIHRDIKSTNILLNENLEAKLADFGLSRAYTIDDGSYVSTRVVGTPGYVDPEYYEMQRLHEKSDIYSFGVVILELITGRPVISGADQARRHIVHWISNLLDMGDIASIVDPKLSGVYDVGTVWRALEIAMTCTSPTSLDRPNTARVLAELKDCLVAEKTRSEDRQDTDASYLHKADQGILEIDIKPR